MAHIDLNNDLPGIRGLMAFRPAVAAHLNELAELLLRADNSLSRGERELIGTYVSYLNDCTYCQSAHQALAQHYLECELEEMEKIKRNPETSDLPPKLKTLLAIAKCVQLGGKAVSENVIHLAKKEGATDLEIHDTVLIAASFCMFNRYVDGLGTHAPSDIQFYLGRAESRAKEGYAAYNPLH